MLGVLFRVFLFGQKFVQGLLLKVVVFGQGFLRGLLLRVVVFGQRFLRGLLLRVFRSLSSFAEVSCWVYSFGSSSFVEVSSGV